MPYYNYYGYGYGPMARFLEYPAGVDPKDCLDYPFCTEKLGDVKTVKTVKTVLPYPEMATRLLFV